MNALLKVWRLCAAGDKTHLYLGTTLKIMKKILSIIFITISFGIIAQNSVIYEAEKKPIKIGKYTYVLDYEYSYQPEGKFHSFSEVLIKGNRKQYISHFVYQLKDNTSLRKVS